MNHNHPSNAVARGARLMKQFGPKLVEMSREETQPSSVSPALAERLNRLDIIMIEGCQGLTPEGMEAYVARIEKRRDRAK